MIALFMSLHVPRQHVIELVLRVRLELRSVGKDVVVPSSGFSACCHDLLPFCRLANGLFVEHGGDFFDQKGLVFQDDMDRVVQRYTNKNLILGTGQRLIFFRT